MGTELESFQRQVLIERLTQRFAKINKYEIEATQPISEVQHPQIKICSQWQKLRLMK
ncbi:MAG: hypothetical protein HC908_14100 [Calothrix sp. SM1_7_51]|nr:hypothetical protein [Calothrix sp. SM1_7_51]